MPSSAQFYFDIPEVNFVVKQGATWVEPVFEWVDENGVLVPLTGFTARSEFYDKQGGGILFPALTSGAGTIVLTDPGIITFNVPAATTAAYTWREAVYDLRLTSAGGVVSFLAHGRAVLRRTKTVGP